MFSATVMVGKSAYDWKTMPTPRLRGGTSLTTRPSKRISPASGRSKPAITRSVVVLPQPEPPTRETSSPWPISRESPSTAVDAPKRFVRRSRLMRTSAGELLQPALHEPVLVGERDADRRLARRRHAPRRAAGLRDLGQVPVERFVVLPHLVLAEPRRVAREQEVRRARRGRVGHDDVALVLRVEEVRPRLGWRQPELGHFLLVHGERDRQECHALPHVLRVLEARRDRL